MISLQPPLSLSLVEIDLSPTKLTTNANDQKNKKQKKKKQRATKTSRRINKAERRKLETIHTGSFRLLAKVYIVRKVFIFFFFIT